MDKLYNEIATTDNNAKLNSLNAISTSSYK